MLLFARNCSERIVRTPCVHIDESAFVITSNTIALIMRCGIAAAWP